jgi:hypothetical protein
LKVRRLKVRNLGNVQDKAVRMLMTVVPSHWSKT